MTGAVHGAAVDAAAQRLAALELSALMADGERVSLDQVFAELCRLPDNLLCLLHSPQGWAALADYAAANLGAGSPLIRPTIH